MIYWAIAMFVLTGIAAIFGFGELVRPVIDIAKILFFCFLSLAILSAVLAALETPDDR